jgi:diguanylate cyclase (GGDEF)-like protein
MGTPDHDALTGTYRRDDLAPILERRLQESAAAGAPLSLAIVDIDHFKTLNDGFGHAAGDRVLREVARRLMGALREHDLVFRYGGDEFVVLLPGTPLEDAVTVLGRVRRRVRQRPVDAGVEVRVHLSIGVASTADVPGEGVPDGLFERADARLLRAKRRGRDRLVDDDEDDVAGPLPEVRLLGRERATAEVDAWLGDPAPGPGALRLEGPPGAGFTRLLREAAARARLHGRAVRRVTGTPALEGLHLGAIAAAFDDDPGEPDEDELRRRLRREADESGLTLLIEHGEHLDADSRALAQELAGRPGCWAVEACPDGTRPILSEARRARLEPLGANQLEAWLRAVLGGRPSADLLRAAQDVGAGRPGPTARWLRRARDAGALRSGPDGWRIDPGGVAASEDEARPPVRVPRWEGPLVGRRRLLARWRSELAEERLLVLVGPGGIGKTRLAAQLAHELADGAPGGTDWIELRTLRPGDDLVAAVARQLDLGALDGVAELARRLGDAPRRLVLDDADRIGDDAGALAALLAAAPQLRLLATSRRPLRLEGERTLPVDGLDEPGQAAALLRQRIRRTTGRDAPVDPQDEAALLAHVGGSPLAIELAAAWTQILPVAQLARALRRRPGLLAEAPGLQARAGATIALTRELMSPREREMVGTLALLEDGFEAEEAQRAVGASPFFLLALLDRALVRRHGSRYRMHALVAEGFARGLARPDEARRALADAYADLAGRIDAWDGPERSSAGYRRVDAELANLRLAWATLLDPPRPEGLWPLARLLRGYHDLRGRAREGLELYRRADGALDERHDAELRAFVRESVALFLTQQGRHEDAATAASQALALIGEGAPGTAAQAHNTLGIARAYLGDVDGARSAFETSARLRRAIGDAVGEAQALGNVALLLEQSGRAEEARVALRSSIEAYRAVDHASGLALALGRLALLERQAAVDGDDPDRLEAARALAEEALHVAEGIGFELAAEAADAELAEALLAAGRPDRAWPHAERALERARRLEARPRARQARLRRGRAGLALGRMDAVREELERLEAEEGTADAPDRAGRLLLAAEAARVEGDLLHAGRLLGAVRDAVDDDLARWWRAAHDAWWTAAEAVGTTREARAALEAGARIGPDAVRTAAVERRGSGAGPPC